MTSMPLYQPAELDRDDCAMPTEEELARTAARLVAGRGRDDDGNVTYTDDAAAARKELVMRSARLGWKLAWRRANGDPRLREQELRELYALAMETFWEASETWSPRPGRSVSRSWVAYATTAFRHALRGWLTSEETQDAVYGWQPPPSSVEADELHETLEALGWTAADVPASVELAYLIETVADDAQRALLLHLEDAIEDAAMELAQLRMHAMMPELMSAAMLSRRQQRALGWWYGIGTFGPGPCNTLNELAIAIGLESPGGALRALQSAHERIKKVLQERGVDSPLDLLNMTPPEQAEEVTQWTM